MVLRLAVLTLLLVIFAFGFSTLVHSNNESRRLASTPFSGCYDQVWSARRRPRFARGRPAFQERPPQVKACA